MEFHDNGGYCKFPAVANGEVFVGSNYGAVYCINSSNGELVWYYQTSIRVESSPASQMA